MEWKLGTIPKRAEILPALCYIRVSAGRVYTLVNDHHFRMNVCVCLCVREYVRE